MFVIRVAAGGKVHQDCVQRFRYIGVYFPEIDEPVVEDDVDILKPYAGCNTGIALSQLLHRHITPRNKIDENVAEAEEIIAEPAFRMEISEIEIDPAASAGPAVSDHMIPTDIAVYLAVIVQEFDGMDQIDEFIENCGEMMQKIVLMRRAEREDAVGKRLPRDEIEYAHDISGAVKG